MTIAIIKSKDGSTYASPIFALKYEGLQSEAIAFDESFSHVKRINFWERTHRRIYRQIFVVEKDFETRSGKWVGLDWVINDMPLWKALKSSEGASIAEFPCLKDYVRNPLLPERFELKTSNDISALEDVSFGFHDAVIQEYTESENEIVIKFDTTWDCYITVMFSGVIEADIKEKIGQILDSEIVQTEIGFCFTVTDGFSGWIDGIDFDTPIGTPYIKCKKIFWKIELA